RRSRSPWAAVVLVVVLVVAGVVVAKGLTDATLYYYNVDEAVAKRDEIGSDRIRLQGEVQERVRDDGDAVLFDVAFAGETLAVRHVGDPPDLFEPGVPVVLEGRFEGETFASDRMLIKHSEEYKSENPDRVSEDAP
ncbi:MAG: cytochrome c maturation protein CcmE, partial [Acidimicrobiales bacterium]